MIVIRLFERLHGWLNSSTEGQCFGRKHDTHTHPDDDVSLLASMFNHGIERTACSPVPCDHRIFVIISVRFKTVGVFSEMM